MLATALSWRQEGGFSDGAKLQKTGVYRSLATSQGDGLACARIMRARNSPCGFLQKTAGGRVEKCVKRRNYNAAKKQYQKSNHGENAIDCVKKYIDMLTILLYNRVAKIRAYSALLRKSIRKKDHRTTYKGHDEKVFFIDIFVVIRVLHRGV